MGSDRYFFEVIVETQKREPVLVKAEIIEEPRKTFRFLANVKKLKVEPLIINAQVTEISRSTLRYIIAVAKEQPLKSVNILRDSQDAPSNSNYPDK